MPQALLLSAGQRPRAKRRVATGSDPSASIVLQASSTEHASKTMCHEHFGGTRVKAPAEHRLPVHTKAERELLVNVWSQRGQTWERWHEIGPACLQFVCHSAN